MITFEILKIDSSGTTVVASFKNAKTAFKVLKELNELNNYGIEYEVMCVEMFECIKMK